MCVIPECSIIEVAQVWHHSIDASDEALILYISQKVSYFYASKSCMRLTFDNVELVASTPEASDRFAEVLRQDLELAFCLLAADENLTD